MFEITWDDRKAIDNPKKHGGVTFEEGQTIFFDPLVQYFSDPHPDGNRMIAIGVSDCGQLLLVSFIDYYPDRHHVLSARKPTQKERASHEKGI